MAQREQMEQQPDPEADPVLHLLRPNERLDVQARATDGTLAVTDQRIVLADGNRVALDIAFDGLRRIQFDIEHGRPATLVVVPIEARAEPHVLSVPPENFDDVARALALIGRRIAELDDLLPSRQPGS